MVTFQPLTQDETARLRDALKANAGERNLTILVGSDTSFVGATDVVKPNELPISDEEVVSAVKSVPCHY